MIELTVMLVAVMAIFATILQVASLTKAHTDMLVEAREKAAIASSQDTAPLTDAAYIKDWETGSGNLDDHLHYTSDDVSTKANAAMFTGTIVNKAATSSDEWELMQKSQSDISGLQNSPNPSTDFGLVKGEASTDVETLGAIRSLIYRKDSITVGCDVWLTLSGGVY